MAQELCALATHLDLFFRTFYNKGMGDIKKQFYSYAGRSFLAASFVAAAPVSAQACAHPPRTTATLAVDADSGAIIESHNADAPAAPASTLKLLPFLAVYEAEKAGLLSFNDVMTISAEARRAAGGNRLSGFRSVKIGDALRAAAVYSLNDLAEQLEIEAVRAYGLSTSAESRFKFRNDLARRAGMNHSQFYSASGMPVNARSGGRIADKNTTTVRDMVSLMLYIHKHYPALKTLLGQQSVHVQGRDFITTNNTLRSGALPADITLIGKTGYTCDARSAFNGMIMSARGNVAFATVGNASAGQRHNNILTLVEKTQTYFINKATYEALVEAQNRPENLLPDGYEDSSEAAPQINAPPQKTPAPPNDNPAPVDKALPGAPRIEIYYNMPALHAA